MYHKRRIVTLWGRTWKLNVIVDVIYTIYSYVGCKVQTLLWLGAE